MTKPNVASEHFSRVMAGAETSISDQKTIDGKSTVMQFILTGFRQDTSIRVFAFEGTAPDRTRTEYTVKADLALTRRYGIQTQDLPLLCRRLLDQRGESSRQYAITFTEEEMRLHARACTEAHNAALLRRKPARRPVITSQTGSGWRGMSPQSS
jgi:hypothetical protein